MLTLSPLVYLVSFSTRLYLVTFTTRLCQHNSLGRQLSSTRRIIGYSEIGPQIQRFLLEQNCVRVQTSLGWLTKQHCILFYRFELNLRAINLVADTITGLMVWNSGSHHELRYCPTVAAAWQTSWIIGSLMEPKQLDSLAVCFLSSNWFGGIASIDSTV